MSKNLMIEPTINNEFIPFLYNSYFEEEENINYTKKYIENKLQLIIPPTEKKFHLEVTKFVEFCDKIQPIIPKSLFIPSNDLTYFIEYKDDSKIIYNLEQLPFAYKINKKLLVYLQSKKKDLENHNNLRFSVSGNIINDETIINEENIGNKDEFIFNKEGISLFLVSNKEIPGMIPLKWLNFQENIEKNDFNFKINQKNFQAPHIIRTYHKYDLIIYTENNFNLSINSNPFSKNIELNIINENKNQQVILDENLENLIKKIENYYIKDLNLIEKIPNPIISSISLISHPEKTNYKQLEEFLRLNLERKKIQI